MSWINPPAAIRRFTVHQRVQHFAAIALVSVSAVSACGSVLAGGAGWATVHRNAGLGAGILLLYHLLVLVSIGIRANVSADRIAFWPTAEERSSLRGKGAIRVGKYSPEEKTDYLVLVALSMLMVLTGAMLLWPGRLGIPAGAPYAWIRTVHAGGGAAVVLHLVISHVPGRWIDAPAGFRKAVFTGNVPLEDAVPRSGWVDDLVSEGVLVPLPRETERKEIEESRHVREFLEMGNRLVLEGDLEGACSAYENALRLYPGYSQALFNLGIARFRQGRLDLARETLLLFVDTDPFNPMVSKAREILAGLPGNPEDGRP